MMCMLMYKFGLRIDALTKLKVSDLLPVNVILFKEKNSKLIKRKFLKETSDLLRLLINNIFFIFLNMKMMKIKKVFFYSKIQEFITWLKSFFFFFTEILFNFAFKIYIFDLNFKKASLYSSNISNLQIYQYCFCRLYNHQ